MCHIKEFIFIHAPLSTATWSMGHVALSVPKCTMCMPIERKCYRISTTYKEFMADPGSKSAAFDSQNFDLEQSSDWRTAYCRLKEDGDAEVNGQEERERDWCWQVGIFPMFSSYCTVWQSDGEQQRNPTTQLSSSGSKILFHPTYRFPKFFLQVNISFIRQFL